MNGYRLVESAWWLFIILFIVAITYGVTGCTETQCVKPIISMPEPILPTVSATEMQCLTDSAWTRLWERDLALQSALRDCRSVVKELAEVPE